MDEDKKRTLTFAERSIYAVTDAQAKMPSHKKKNRKKKRQNRRKRKDVFASEKQEETFIQTDPVTKAADPGSKAAGQEEKEIRKSKDSRIQHIPDKGKENIFASSRQKQEKTFIRVDSIPETISETGNPPGKKENQTPQGLERRESGRKRFSENEKRGSLFEKSYADYSQKQLRKQSEKRMERISYRERADPSGTNLSHTGNSDRVMAKSRLSGRNSRVRTVKETGAAESASKTGETSAGSSGGTLVISGAKKTIQGTKKTVQRVKRSSNRILQAGFGTSMQASQNTEQQKQRLKQIGSQKLQSVIARSGKKAVRSTVKYSAKLVKAAASLLIRIGILIGSVIFAVFSPVVIILVLILGAAGGDTLDVNLPLPLYVTYDSRWGGLDYGPGTIYDSGSHVCSIAMAVSYVLDSEITPNQIVSWAGSDYYSPDILDDRLFYAAAEHYHLTILPFSDFSAAAAELMQRQLHTDQRPVLLGITKAYSVFGDAASSILIDPDANWDYCTIYSPRDTRKLDLFYAPKNIDDVETGCQRFYILDLDPD